MEKYEVNLNKILIEMNELRTASVDMLKKFRHNDLDIQDFRNHERKSTSTIDVHERWLQKLQEEWTII